MTHALLSAYERWTWKHCQERILSLKGRLGYGERLWILGFELLDDGRLLDPFHGVEVFDPTRAGPPLTIPACYSAVPEMYCILSTYAAAADVLLTDDWISLTALDPVQRPQLSAEDCAALLLYARQDLGTLRRAKVPFFGATLECGDLAFVVWSLPRVPIRFTLWCGDDEVPDGGTLLFERSAAHYLPNLLAELGWLTVWRLKNILDAQVRWGYHHLAARGGENGS